MKDLNELMEINQETREILTEPYQPILVGVKQEQWNALVKHTTTVGQALIENIALVAGLPTMEYLDCLMIGEVERHHKEVERILKNEKQYLTDSLMTKLAETERKIQRTVTNQTADMMEKLKARDLSPAKLKAKWVGIGAILPSMLWLWQLLLSHH